MTTLILLALGQGLLTLLLTLLLALYVARIHLRLRRMHELQTAQLQALNNIIVELWNLRHGRRDQGAE